MANLLGEITGRPKDSDDEIIKEASQKFAVDLMKWCKAGGEQHCTIKEFEEDAFEVLDGCFSHYDGYKIAKALEDDHYYSADESLVDICSGAWNYVHEAHSKALKIWIKDNNVVCPFKIGDTVKYYRNVGGWRTGVIKNIDNTRAECTCFNIEYGHSIPNGGCTVTGDLVHFENMELVKDTENGI